MPDNIRQLRYRIKQLEDEKIRDGIPKITSGGTNGRAMSPEEEEAIREWMARDTVRVSAIQALQKELKKRLLENSGVTSASLRPGDRKWTY
jgi:hypothetical protein